MEHDALSEGGPCVAASSSDVCAQWRLPPCGHTYCNRASCASAQAVECPECRQAVAGRVVLFGALANVKAALAAGGAIAEKGVTQSRRGEREDAVFVRLVVVVVEEESNLSILKRF